MNLAHQKPWQDLTISKLLRTTSRASPYLLSYDKFIIMKENKCSQLSLKMPQSLFLNIQRLELLIYTFIIQQIPSLSPEIPVILFIRRFKKKKKDLKSTLQQHSAFLWNSQGLKYYVHFWFFFSFSFSKLDTSFSLWIWRKNYPLKTVLEIVFCRIAGSWVKNRRVISLFSKI